MNDSVVFNTSSSSTNSTHDLIWTITNVEITVFSINVLFGLPVHCYIVWLIVRGGEIASNFFNLNLSICETLYASLCFFLALSRDFPDFLLTAQFFVGLGITGRPLFQSLICVERYLAVVHPVTFLKFKPLRYRLICSAAAWIISLGCCFFCRFVLALQSFIKFTWLLSIQFLILCSVQLFCCVAVLRALRQSGPGERGREREENNMKRRAFYLILITTVTMIIMFVPYIVTGILVLLKKDFSVIWLISFCCFILCAFVHPVLYLSNKTLSCLRKNLNSAKKVNST